MDLKRFKVQASRKKAKLKAFLTKLDDIVPEDMPKLVAETAVRPIGDQLSH